MKKYIFVLSIVILICLSINAYSSTVNYPKDINCLSNTSQIQSTVSSFNENRDNGESEDINNITISASSFNILNIKLVGGQDIKVSLYKNPKLVFNSNLILLKSDNQIYEFSSNDIVDFYYSSVSSGIDDIYNDGQNDFIITNDGIDLIKNSNVSIYKLDGSLVMNGKVQGMLLYTNLPAGYLIFNINNISFKYLNQQR